MIFGTQIQLGHPKINQGSFSRFEKVKDVFLELFRVEEESLYLFWHDVPIRFRYCKDLHQIFDDILAMIWMLQDKESGAAKVTLQNQLLSMTWAFRWQGDDLQIDSVFSARDELYRKYADALNKNASIKVSKKAFLSEWKTLLHQIVISFDAGNIEIEDGTERRKLEMMQSVEASISGYGKLYTRAQ